MESKPKVLHWKDRSHRFTPHFHTEFYVGVILQGRCEFQCGSKDHVATAGDLVLIDPYEVHTAGCSPDVEYRAVYLDDPAMHRLAGVGSAAEEPGPHLLSFDRTVVRGSDAAAAFADVLADTRQLVDLAAPLQRILERHMVARPFDVNLRDFQHTVIAEMEAASDAGTGPAPIAELAQRLGMGAQTFSRVFHRVFGVPAVFFRNQLRLHRAEERLGQGASAMDIAFECGFSDQAHLIRELKKFRGVTPKLYATAYRLIEG